MKRNARTNKKSAKNLDVRNCICGRRPELNKTETAGHHPDKFQLKAGMVCFVVVTTIVYIVDPWWTLGPFILAVAIAGLATMIKVLRGHTMSCAIRDGVLISIAFFANVLEALNPGNWI